MPAQSAASVGEVLAGIPMERIALIEGIFRRAARDLGITVASSTVLAVIDHLHVALERTAHGTTMDYPLRAEVMHLHPEELRLAERMVSEINAAQPVELPRGEASALAMHLFTAAVGAPSAQEAARQSRLIAQVMTIIQEVYASRFDPDSIDAARFATHLRYFLARARRKDQLEDGTGRLVASTLETRFPRAHTVARRIASLLELRLGTPVSQDEVAYLTLHVARIEESGTRRGESGPRTTSAPGTHP